VASPSLARQSLIGVLALLALVVLIGLTGLGNSSPGRGPGERGDKSDKAKAAERQVTLSGTVASSTDAEGRATYTLSSGGTTYELDAGPSWFFGDNHPLSAFVGKSVTIVGEQREGSTEVDVRSVDGTVLREPGKPPWAGGWKRVGEGHPGWSQEKADRQKQRSDDCFPPGQCKEKPSDDDGDQEESPAP
jgi:hypothetical protein